MCLSELVRSGSLTLDVDPGRETLDVASVETEFKYEGYIRRELVAVDRQRRQENRGSRRVRLRGRPRSLAGSRRSPLTGPAGHARPGRSGSRRHPGCALGPRRLPRPARTLRLRSDTLAGVAARDARTRLLRRASKADITLSSALADRLVAYLELLLRWNRKINLTALDDLDAAVDRLLLEPLAAVPHVNRQNGRLLDLGSGGGSPAIPLALSLPGLDLTMVEVKGRKAAFLREAVACLTSVGPWLKTFASRTFWTVTASAALTARSRFAPFEWKRRMLRDVAEFLGPDGLALLFRGPSGPAELPDAGPLAWTGTYPLVDASASRLFGFRRVE